MAKRRRRKSGGAACNPGCIKGKGRLRKGCRWAKGRKKCAVPAKKR